MTQVVAFVGAKGGTLKTASVAAVAHLAAKAGLRVVMVDGDPQADLTSRSGFARVADPLTAELVPVQFQGEPEMDLRLLRGGRSMEAADVSVAERHIRRAVETGADLVVIDTPPALGPITTASIRASGLVVIPAMPGKESLERSHDVISLARAGKRVPVVRILLTLAHLQSNLFRWMVEQVDALYPGARMRPVIPYEMPAGEAALFEVPVTVSAPKSRSSLAYCEVSADVIQRLGLRVAPPAPVIARGVA
ncbi:MAG TPA: ParA family protein [Longimicrobium sp.]|jgi:chromosome partitioning protein